MNDVVSAIHQRSNFGDPLVGFSGISERGLFESVELMSQRRAG